MNGKDYLCWLMNQCRIVAEGPDGYLRLCEILQSTYFVSLVEFDENRADEGRHLRSEWGETDHDISETSTELIPYTCTMLELILVIGRRMQYEMTDSQYEAEIGKWVKELLENAGLAYWRNDIYDIDPEYSEMRIRTILNNLIYRRYAPNGEGGFFPCNWTIKDQRNEELLTQMNNYLAENYDIC